MVTRANGIMLSKNEPWSKNNALKRVHYQAKGHLNSCTRQRHGNPAYTIDAHDEAGTPPCKGNFLQFYIRSTYLYLKNRGVVSKILRDTQLLWSRTLKRFCAQKLVSEASVLQKCNYTAVKRHWN